MNTWYEVKCKYTREFEDGRLKRVTEPYLIDATSFTEAEERAFGEVAEDIKGEFLITAIKKENIADIFGYEDSDVWFKAKVKFSSIDADSGKENATIHNILVTAADAREAYLRVESSMRGLMVSFEIVSVSKTKIVEVLPYKQGE